MWETSPKPIKKMSNLFFIKSFLKTMNFDRNEIKKESDSVNTRVKIAKKKSKTSIFFAW